MIRQIEARPGLAVLLMAPAVSAAVIWGVKTLQLWPAGVLLLMGAIIVPAGFLFLSAHPLRPAIFMAAITPFEGLVGGILGFLSNLLTPLVIVSFIIGMRGSAVDVFLATPIQRLVFAFVVSSIPSFLPGLFATEMATGLAFGQRVSLILLLGLFAYSMLDVTRTAVLAKALALSGAAIALIAIVSFYLGNFGLAPIERVTTSIWGQVGLLGSVDIDTISLNPITTDLRLRGPADSTEINRFAMWLLLPAFLAIGWLTTARSPWGILAAAGSLAVLVTALLGTASRSGLLGLAAGVAVMGAAGLLQAGHRRLVLPAVLMALFLGIFILTQTGVGTIAGSRLIQGWLDPGDRIEIWSEAVSRMASPQIITGLGGRVFGDGASDSFLYLGAHNAFLQMALENGIISSIIFLLIVVRASWVLLQPVASGERDLALWKYAFLAGLTGMVVSILFGNYAFERFLWIALAFAVSLEMRSSGRPYEVVRRTPPG